MPKAAAPASPLKLAMADKRLRDVDVATRLSVDPKTVQRWLQGRLPQYRHRWVLADLLGVHEFDLWPQLASPSAVAPAGKAPSPYRAAGPRTVWRDLFVGARHEIGILVYSGLFIAEDIELIRILERKAEAGVTVRLLLGDPDSNVVAVRGTEEGIADAMGAKIRNALVLYRPLLEQPGVELRLHRTVLYNSLYRADDDLLVNQHVFGVGASQAPVLHLHRDGQSELFATYLASFERVWEAATDLHVHS